MSSIFWGIFYNFFSRVSLAIYFFSVWKCKNRRLSGLTMYCIMYLIKCYVLICTLYIAHLLCVVVACLCMFVLCLFYCLLLYWSLAHYFFVQCLLHIILSLLLSLSMCVCAIVNNTYIFLSINVLLFLSMFILVAYTCVSMWCVLCLLLMLPVSCSLLPFITTLLSFVSVL